MCLTLQDQPETAFDYSLRPFTLVTIVISQSDVQLPTVAVATRTYRL